MAIEAIQFGAEPGAGGGVRDALYSGGRQFEPALTSWPARQTPVWCKTLTSPPVARLDQTAESLLQARNGVGKHRRNSRSR